MLVQRPAGSSVVCRLIADKTNKTKTLNESKTSGFPNVITSKQVFIFITQQDSKYSKLNTNNCGGI